MLLLNNVAEQVIVLNMFFSDRRRSWRLSGKPWLFNWPRKRPVHVDLRASVDVHSNQGTTDLNEKTGKIGSSTIADGLNCADGDFVTPGEMFGERSESVETKCSIEKKKLKLTREIVFSEKGCSTIVESSVLVNLSKSKLRSREYELLTNFQSITMKEGNYNHLSLDNFTSLQQEFDGSKRQLKKNANCNKENVGLSPSGCS
ncbi:hypothetical protein POM88_030898 [Heracleum sosnowskyi]|uniref:Uncharacterized protein n=1 Tax=Heracleum sosnowskyi TaxID=360622 RepID=A0AAD8HWS0_9APIA|nr:hypothetical protein POM88_030898 [Heracleum sosnowskyi]